MEAAWRALERRVPGGQAIAFPEPEKADNPVDIEEEKGLSGFFWHKKVVTNVRSAGRVNTTSRALSRLQQFRKARRVRLRHLERRAT
jgi:hypothetical protein